MRVVNQLRANLRRKDLRVEFQPVEASQRIPFLKAGRIDIECGANTNTVQRQKDVDFSHTFFNTGVRLLAKRNLRVDVFSDVWRRRIAATKGTTALDIVERLGEEWEVVPVPVDNDAQGLTLLESGRVDAFAQDDVLLYGLMDGSPIRDELWVTGKLMSVEPYAFMLPKGDKAFIQTVDEAVLQLLHSGEIFQVYERWFDTPRLRIPLSIHMRENIRFPNKCGIP